MEFVAPSHCPFWELREREWSGEERVQRGVEDLDGIISPLIYAINIGD